MELPSPITVHWDLPAESELTTDLVRFADHIVACRPLMLQVADPSPVFRPEVASVVGRLTASPTAVSLTLPVPAFVTAREILAGLSLKEILVGVTEAADIPEPFSPATGMSCAVKAENWRRLPDLVAAVRTRGIRRLVLPMQRLYGREKPFFLTADEQKELSALLAAKGGCSGLDLTIHDPFLWQAFNPGVPFPQGGCQAANTMIAVGGDGTVYPCPSLPVRLGSLREQTLKDIVASAAKKDLRRQLLDSPRDCTACGVLTTCKGGCRGRGYVAGGSLDAPDPACR